MIVGIKSGAFSLIHAGHIWALEQCGKQCDHLIVLINDDDFIERKKGFVPLSAKERKYIISHHDYVDEVHIFSGINENQWIKNFITIDFIHQFGNEALLRVFHSDELEGRAWVPGQDYAYDIVYIPKKSSPFKNSVSEMTTKIRFRGFGNYE